MLAAAPPRSGIPTSTTPPATVTRDVDKILGYVFDVLGWAGGISFVVIGGMFCWCYLGGEGTAGTMRALASAATGCVLVGISSVLAKAVFA